MRIPILLSALLLSPIALSAGAKADLRTSMPPLGLAPLYVTFIARVDGTEEELWCPAVRWTFDDGRSSSTESDCEPYEDGDRATKIYTVKHIYRAPGDYRAKFELRKAGKLIAAASMLVQVADPTVIADAH
jgi:hypothetical protein